MNRELRIWHPFIIKYYFGLCGRPLWDQGGSITASFFPSAHREIAYRCVCVKGLQGLLFGCDLEGALAVICSFYRWKTGIHRDQKSFPRLYCFMVLMLRHWALSLWTWDSTVDALGRNRVAFLYSLRDLKVFLKFFIFCILNIFKMRLPIGFEARIFSLGIL